MNLNMKVDWGKTVGNWITFAVTFATLLVVKHFWGFEWAVIFGLAEIAGDMVNVRPVYEEDK